MSDTNTLFITATKNHWRYNGAVRSYTTEELWSLPLTRADGGDSLDSVSRNLLAQIAELGTVSLVESNEHEATKKVLDQKLEVMRVVIESIKADIANREEAARKAGQKATIRQILAEKNLEDLRSKSTEELEDMIAES